MSEREKRRLPDWAERERAGDLAWIKENLGVFWTAAQQGYEELGRGAIVVDTTQQPTGEGHPFGYFPEEMVEQSGDEDAQRMVREYDPSWEMVTVLLKTDNRVSIYRVGQIPPRSQEVVEGEVTEVTPVNTGESIAEPKLEPPDVERLIEWEAEGGCEAACPHHCWVEPNGTCTHGNPSWLLRLGLI